MRVLDGLQGKYTGLLSKYMYTEYYWLMMAYKLQAKYTDSSAKYTD